MNTIALFSAIFLTAAIAINLLLTFFVYKQNRKSATNVLFSLLGILISLWLLSMYYAQQPSFYFASLLITRLTFFLATPMDITFFIFALTVPREKMPLRTPWKWVFAVLGIIIMILALSPYTFQRVDIVNNFPKPIIGPAISLVGGTNALLVLLAVYVLGRRSRKATGEEKKQIRLIMYGILIMFGLVIATIFLPVLFFQDASFVALAPLYTLIFLGITAYTIVKHQLFDLKVVATEALVSVLWVVLLARVIEAPSTDERVVSSFILTAVFIFGIFLIRSVREEVKQREKLEQLTKKLEEANVHLEDLSRFKSQLLSIASHQIKSPLAIIKGYLGILLQGLYGPVEGQVRVTLEKVKQAADGLTLLIEDLLNLRKVEEGKMDYKFAPVDVAALVEGIVESFRVLAYQKGLVLDYKKEPKGPLMIEADVEKLHEVFQNLLDNALKYTPKGFIHAQVGMSGDKARITVSDSGLGIPADLLPRLFEEFVRDERVRKEIQGSGFGLYIAKKIVEAHGGKIWAESPGESKGSSFIVELPLSAGKAEEDKKSTKALSRSS